MYIRILFWFNEALHPNLFLIKWNMKCFKNHRVFTGTYFKVSVHSCSHLFESKLSEFFFHTCRSLSAIVFPINPPQGVASCFRRGLLSKKKTKPNQNAQFLNRFRFWSNQARPQYSCFYVTGPWSLAIDDISISFPWKKSSVICLKLIQIHSLCLISNTSNFV